MKLSENFTLYELTRTDTGLTHIPNDTEQAFLKLLAVYILQPLRVEVGQIKITSGFRSPDVNKAVGGGRSSQHLQGQAADLRPVYVHPLTLYRWIVDVSGLDYGQCIIYPDKGFIHISLPRLGVDNCEALIYSDGKYLPF